MSWIKNIIAPHSTWKDYIKHVMMLNYLDSEPDNWCKRHPEGMLIKEVGVKLGGTLIVNAKTGVD